MAVTELVWLAASAGDFTPENKEASSKALDVQDQWCAEQAPSLPNGKVGRGVAMFRQVEDPHFYLLTAVWVSPEQHQQWLAAEENASAMQGLSDHFVLEETTHCYLENAIFNIKESDSGDLTPLLDSPIISMGQCIVKSTQKAAFSSMRQSVNGLLRDFAEPHQLRESWKVEGAHNNQQFIFVCGWPSVERHMEFA